MGVGYYRHGGAARKHRGGSSAASPFLRSRQRAVSPDEMSCCAPRRTVRELHGSVLVHDSRIALGDGWPAAGRSGGSRQAPSAARVAALREAADAAPRTWKRWLT